MGGEGSMTHMIVTMRNNRNLRRKRKSYKEITDKHATQHNADVKKEKPIFSAKQKQKSQKIVSKVKKQKLADRIIYGIFLFAILVLITIAMVWYLKQ